MSLKEQITNDMKTAMRNKETDRLNAIRLLLAAIKQKEVDERIELTDANIVSIIEKMIYNKFLKLIKKLYFTALKYETFL